MSELRDLRMSTGATARDMVAVVQELYPKYDKTLQSKCENPDYGVALPADAMAALYQRFAPERLEPARPRRRDAHRLGCRISCRLEKTAYDELQQACKADGFRSMQELVSSLVKKYLETHRKENECWSERMDSPKA